jgi:hypothetical protein
VQLADVCDVTAVDIVVVYKGWQISGRVHLADLHYAIIVFFHLIVLHHKLFVHLIGLPQKVSLLASRSKVHFRHVIGRLEAFDLTTGFL